MATTRRHRDRDHVPLTALGGAALVHAALLAPLAFGALGAAFESVQDVEAPAMLIQLEPRTVPVSSPVATTSASTSAAARAVTERRPLPFRPAPHRPLALPDATSPPAEVVMPIDSRWRVRPAIGGSGWGDCPDAFTNPSAQALCNERDRMRLAAATARRAAAPPPASLQSPDADPSGAFARTAAANKAWRDYTRNEGAYPGLRSLLRDH